MKRSFKTRIYPNNKQKTYLNGCFGLSRFVYNTCLAIWDSEYRAGGKPNFYSVRNEFNARRKIEFQWTYEYSKWIIDSAARDLASGFKKFFKGTAKCPKFHKKGVKDSFRIDGSVIKIDGKYLKLPKGLTLKMAESLRYKDAIKIYNVTVSKRADMYFVAIACEVPDTASESQAAVGIDLGCHVLMALSDGTVIENPRWYRRREKRMKHLQRELARKKKGSKNWYKAKRRLAMYQYCTSCMRADYIHKSTSKIAKEYGIVFLEDLNISGMAKNHKLAKSISDASMSVIVEQLSYKTITAKIDRWYPSSKTCSNCGCIQDMPLKKRTYICPDCGAVIDRDINAAVNILKVGMANYPELMPVEGVDADMAERSEKQESNSKLRVA